jgi:AraC-like DNA-binding protein
VSILSGCHITVAHLGLCKPWHRAAKPRGMAAEPRSVPEPILLALRNKTGGFFNMPDSAVVTFTDLDAYHAALRDVQAQGAVTARGKFHAELTRVDLHRLSVHRGEETLPRVANSAVDPKLYAIIFATNPSQPSVYISGLELSPADIIVHRVGSVGHNRSAAGCRWGFMSLPHEDLAAAGEALIGRELTAPSFTHRITPPTPLLSRLLNLHEAAGRLAKTAPDILTHPEVARALEQGLVHAMVSCISGGEAAETSGAHHRHAAIMRRLEAVLEANPDRTLYVAELCAATRTSDRTLRVCCQEHLGMSPMRYLWLRRMHLARRALRLADPAAMTVTEIATNYGFWELGRFSVAYRSLFSETPSASLLRPPDDLRPKKSNRSPWRLPESA